MIKLRQKLDYAEEIILESQVDKCYDYSDMMEMDNVTEVYVQTE